MPRIGYPSGRDENPSSYPSNVAITSAEFAWLFAAGFNAISETGGAYTIRDDMTIGGVAPLTSWTFDCTTNFNNAVNLNSDVEINGGSSGSHNNLYIGQYVDTEVAGNFQYTSGTLQIKTTVQFNGGTSPSHQLITSGAYVDWTFSGFVTFEGNVTIGSTAVQVLNVNSSPVFQSATTFNNDVTVQGGSSGSHKTLTIDQYTDTVVNGGITHAGKQTNTGVTAQQGEFSQTYVHATASTTIGSNVRYVLADIVGGGYIRLTAPTGILSGTATITTIVNQTAGDLEIRNESGGVLRTITSSGANVPWVEILWDGTTFLVYRLFEPV